MGACTKLAVLVAVVAIAAGVALYDGPYVDGAAMLGAGGPQTMRAGVLHYAASYGSGEVPDVRVDDGVPLPAVGQHDVLVRVRATSINPVDFKIAEGFLKSVAWTRLVPTEPFTLGSDLAGEVVAVGPSVTRVKVGDDVYGMAHFSRFGAFAEYISIPEKLVAVMPTSLSYGEAAALPLAGLTSLQALQDFAGVQAGDRVLVIGGASGTGSLGLQIARHLGAAYVATTASARNLEFVQALGADRVVDYREEDVADALEGEGFDVVYDCVGGEEYWHMASARGVLREGGTFVSIVGDYAGGKGAGAMSVGRLLRDGWKMLSRTVGKHRYRIFQTAPSGLQLEQLTAAVDAGTLRPIVDSTFELQDLTDALAASKAGKASGKIVVTVA